MKLINANRERKQLSMLSKVFLGITSVLCLGLLAILLIDRAGYPLKQRDTSMMGACLVIVLLLVWAGVALFKKLKKRAVKFIGGMAIGFVIMFVSILIFTYVGEFTSLTMPLPYASISNSENGRTAVVLRMLDMNLESEEKLNESVERLEVRYNAMVEAGMLEPVDIEGEGYPLEAYGYVITAYPEKLKLFYRINADVTGEIYVGYNSTAKLLYEWLDEDSLRVYLGNPEPGDSGEILIHF